MVKCAACRGRGITKLSDTLQRTLDAVPRKGQSSTGEIFRQLMEADVNQTAINNRLHALEKLGLVEFTTKGKAKIWRRTPR